MARRRLRSSTVVLGGMGMLALTITSCGSEPDKRCADPVTMENLPGYECESSDGRGSTYYGGKIVGGTVEEGSFRKEAVEKGGFGCSGSGSGGG